MKLTKHFKKEYVDHWEWMFADLDRDDWRAGWAFECNEQGQLFALDKWQADSYRQRWHDWQAGKLKRRMQHYIQPETTYAEGYCDRCGELVVLYDSFLTTCDECGADYNGSGQLLAPRSQWGWETDESLGDIFNPLPEDW
jgi:hypothetical protein